MRILEEKRIFQKVSLEWNWRSHRRKHQIGELFLAKIPWNHIFMRLVRDILLTWFIPSFVIFAQNFPTTVYFDRMTLTGDSLTKARLARESATDRDKSSKEIYDEIAEGDERNLCIKWHHRLLRSLPFLPIWHIFIRQHAKIWSCCRKDSVFYTQPCYRKIWHVFVNTFRICIYLLAIFVTVIGCGSAVQTKTALAKLPESFKISYGKSLA